MEGGGVKIVYGDHGLNVNMPLYGDTLSDLTFENPNVNLIVSYVDLNNSPIYSDVYISDYPYPSGGYIFNNQFKEDLSYMNYEYQYVTMGLNGRELNVGDILSKQDFQDPIVYHYKYVQPPVNVFFSVTNIDTMEEYVDCTIEFDGNNPTMQGELQRRGTQIDSTTYTIKDTNENDVTVKISGSNFYIKAPGVDTEPISSQPLNKTFRSGDMIVFLIFPS